MLNKIVEIMTSGLLLLLLGGLFWSITCGLVKITAWCFNFDFSILIGTIVWVATLVVGYIANKCNDKKMEE